MRICKQSLPLLYHSSIAGVTHGKKSRCFHTAKFTHPRFLTNPRIGINYWQSAAELYIVPAWLHTKVNGHLKIWHPIKFHQCSCTSDPQTRKGFVMKDKQTACVQKCTTVIPYLKQALLKQCRAIHHTKKLQRPYFVGSVNHAEWQKDIAIIPTVFPL